jgi:hypothetical protein
VENFNHEDTMTTESYIDVTYHPETKSWIIPKQAASAIIEYCSTDKFRPELQHAVFTNHSIGATDGHRLLLLTQKGQRVRKLKKFHSVSRDILLRARACIREPRRERIVVKLDDKQLIKIVRWHGSIVPTSGGEVVAMIPLVQAHHASEDKWAWAAKLRELVKASSKYAGSRENINPGYLTSVDKACRWLGFRCVEMSFGSGEDGVSTMFRAHSRHITCDLNILVMGMRV